MVDALEKKCPQSLINPNEDLVMTEKRKCTVATLTSSNSREFIIYSSISKFGRFIDIICWVKRLILKIRNRDRPFPSELSTEEKYDLGKLIWSRLQSENFGDITDAIKGLKGM